MRLSSLFLPIFIVLTFALSVYPQDERLIQLRRDFAQRYLHPDAHYALAKYYLDQGNLIQAFFILEYARRYRFGEKEFDQSYVAFFGDPMPEPPDEAKDLFKKAFDLVKEQKYDEAETYLLRANAKYDKSFFINAWTGRFYYKTKPDNSKALPYYFKAYFLYPHAYETEYVESRIRAICLTDARQSFQAALKNGKSLVDLIRNPNPIIVGSAIEEMGKSWKPEYLDAMIEAMSNDDSMNRWGAFVTLNKYAGASLDRIVDSLLKDNDIRKRGLAAYALIERKGEDRFIVLKKLLSDPSELVRFDALSALALRGGEVGKQMLAAHQRIEKQPALKALITRELKAEQK